MEFPKVVACIISHIWHLPFPELVACIISHIQHLDEKKEETTTRPSPNNMADPDTYPTPL